MKHTMALGLLFSLLFSPMALAAVALDAGNLTCPVSGDKVSGKDFVEHGGKQYGLCCAMCAGKFTKNAEKYLKDMTEGTVTADHSM